MKNRTSVLAGSLALLLAALGCNLPRPVEFSPSTVDPAASTDPLPSEPPAATAPLPSGLPTFTMEAGTGYLIDVQQVVIGADDRDLWWNAAYIVPGSRMASLGSLDDPRQVAQVQLASLSRDQLVPHPGEVFVIEVAPDTAFALIRILAFGADQEMTIEILFPFPGAIVP